MNIAEKALHAQLAAGKKLAIYGAGSQGRGIGQTLRSLGLPHSLYIDRNPLLQGTTLQGTPVYGPDILEQPGATARYFVIVATFFFERDIAVFLEKSGFSEGVGYWLYSSMKPHDYVVEISGLCNLRCLACPRAARPPSGRNAAMMDANTFRKVIAKIRREDPFAGNLQLYQWGEPTLNKDLPAIIGQARDMGFLCSISSNLNHAADFPALLRAQPSCLRISASGTGREYEITHTGAKWNVFRENIETIARLRRKLHPEMKVEVYYHLYRHSTGPAMKFMADMCERLDFEFHPVPSYIISLDDVLAYCEGTPLPDPARRARDLLLMDIDEGLRQARLESRLACDAQRIVLINADLSVSACMMFYNEENNTVADNFLHTPLDTIVARQARSGLCLRCRKFGIHRYCGVYAKIGEEVRS
jgi:MoaA/NifB/PqqE/SkfB family radical SAM enzyme